MTSETARAGQFAHRASDYPADRAAMCADGYLGPVHQAEVATQLRNDRKRGTPPVPTWPHPGRLRPTLLIIGAQKSGTTSMFRYLRRHPRVRARTKEPHFFDRNWQRGIEYYAKFFPPRPILRQAAVTLDASASYLLNPLAAERAAEVLPDARILLMLRDPVARAWSNYQHNVRRGRITASFEETIREELEKIDRVSTRQFFRDVSGAKEPYRESHLTRGRYAEQLADWLEHFPKNQFLVLAAEHFYRDPQASVDLVTSHWGLPLLRLRDTRAFNVSRSGESIDPRTAARLREVYAPHNAALADLIERHDLATNTTWPRDGSWPATPA